MKSIPLADFDRKIRRNIIKALYLAGKGFLRACKTAVAYNAYHLRREVLFTGCAQHSCTAHGNTVKEQLCIFPETVYKVIRPCYAVPAVFYTHGDIFTFAEPVSPVVRKKHSEAYGLIKFNMRGKFIPCVGLKTVDAYYIFFRAVGSGE